MSGPQSVTEVLAEYQDFDQKRQDFVTRAVELLSSVTNERDEALRVLRREHDAKTHLEWQLATIQGGDASPTDTDVGALESVLSRLQLIQRSQETVSQLRTEVENGELVKAGGSNGPSAAGLEEKPYVLVLLDASSDAFVFRDSLAPRGGKSGGIAAERLYNGVRQYLEQDLPEISGIDIVVKAYANMEGLCQSLLSTGATAACVSEIRPFFSGFSGRFPLCDFSDVGPSKGRSAEKIRGVIDFHLQVDACKHILLGIGSGPDTTEHFSTFAMAESALRRMTMLRSSSVPLTDAELEQLGPLRTTELSTVFIDLVTHWNVKPTRPFLARTIDILTEAKSPEAPAYPEATSYAQAASHAVGLPQSHIGPMSIASTAPLLSDPLHPSVPSLSAITSTPNALHGTSTLRNAAADPSRLGPVMYNKRGRRVDRPLAVAKEHLDWVRKGNLCPYLFLRGECREVGGPRCRKQHSCRPLSAHEWDALWLLTRGKECQAGAREGVCRNPTCVFGHRVRE